MIEGSFKQGEKPHSPNIPNRAPYGGCRTQAGRKRAFQDIEASSDELSETNSTVSGPDSPGRDFSSSQSCQSILTPAEEESDPDIIGVGADDQKQSILISSLSGGIILEPRKAAACHATTALIQTLGDNIIASLQNSHSLINAAPVCHNSQDYIREPTHEINALNVQQIALAWVLQSEIKNLRSELGDGGIKKDSTK